MPWQDIQVVYDEAQFADIKDKIDQLGGAMPTALRDAINKTLTTERSHLVKELSAKTALHQKDLRKWTKIIRATKAHLVGLLRLRSIPEIALGARQVAAGVEFTGEGGQEETELHAFIAVMPSGHRDVMERIPGRKVRRVKRASPTTGHLYEEALPIEELFGENLAVAAAGADALAKVTAETDELLDHYVRQSVDFLLEKREKQA